MKCKIVLFSLIALFSLEKTKSQIDFNNNYLLKSLSLGISFPPVSNKKQRKYTKSLLNELSVNKIRINETWAFREPTQGNFNWEPLDNRINWAYKNNIKILLTITSNGPKWACSTIYNKNSCIYKNNKNFRKYVEKLAKRYKGKIAKIQFGNEWQSDFWYIGSAKEFTKTNNILYNSFKKYSPKTKFVLGGFTTISLRFLTGCVGKINAFYDDEGIFYNSTFFKNNCNKPKFKNVFDKINYVLKNALYDELDIHLYDDVENWDEYYFHFKSITSKPIIVSEFGGPNINYETYSDDLQKDKLFKYIKKLDSLQITEAYYFKLVEGTNNSAHKKSGLIKKFNLSKKKSFKIFKNFKSKTN